jgi:hypothetical protein
MLAHSFSQSDFRMQTVLFRRVHIYLGPWYCFPSATEELSFRIRTSYRENFSLHKSKQNFLYFKPAQTTASEVFFRVPLCSTKL